LKAYLAIIKLRFIVQLQYRAAAAAALFTNYFFGFVRVMVFHAFYASSTVTQPLSLEQAVTYTWLTQVTFRMQTWVTDRETVALVRSGNIAYEFCRPLSLYFVWYCRLISHRLVPGLLTGIPVFVLAAILPGKYGLDLPVSIAAGAASILSTFLALLLGCAITNLISISMLWTVAGDGMIRVFPAVVMLLSGVIMPLAYFPDWAQPVLRLLPFSSLVDIPTNFYLGIMPAHDILIYGPLQIFWIIFFILIGLQVLNLGTKRVVVQGG
jgi:ABC-2 type transport system permease protein